MPFSTLIQHIRQHIEFPEEEALMLDKYFKLRHVKKKSEILKQGQHCQAMYFVVQGCLRMYFINKKAGEQIVQFAIEGWWLSDYFSFIDNTPSEYYIQSIEPSELLVVDKLQFEEMLRELPKLEKYFRIVMQKAVAAAQLRSKLLYEMTKEEFFQHFSNSFPGFMQRVPLYMVASYLGLTPEYVSEIRKKQV
jgi:CRP-like cAMP-binding protein